MTTAQNMKGEPFYFVFNTYEEAIEALPRFESEQAAALRQRAEEKRKREEESFDRCDTDGFVSQYCLSIGAQEDEREAQLANRAYLAVEPALMDIESGQIVACCIRIMSSRFASWETEYKWKVNRSITRPDGRTYPWFYCTDYKRETGFTKLGLRKVYVIAPAQMLSRSPGNMKSEPRGLSGLASYSGKYAYIDYAGAGLPV